MKKTILLILFTILFFTYIDNLYSLEEISVTNTMIVPLFDENTTTYNAYVDESIQIVTINAKLNDNEVLTNTGSKSLKVGNNSFELVLYKDNIEIRKYTINITRGENIINESNALLESLRINNIDVELLDSVFEYNIKLSTDIKEVSYNTVSTYASVKVQEYNDYLSIKVTSFDKSITNEYRINIEKEINEVKESKKSIFDNSDLDEFDLKIVRIVIISVASIILGIELYFLIRMKY